ncbi:MAG: SGNH/GDSL hydrolase family protein [Pleurocapsa sp. MO_226.B13]|nr:SGNH/GDSL hydrolase family protein [Pleurocapsa sp. MO_226.B13]
MLNFRSRERRIFTSRKRIRRRYAGLGAIASLLLFLLVLELLARIFVDLSGNRERFARANTKAEIMQAYRLKFVADTTQTDLVSDSEALMAKPSLAVGYQLLGNQENEYWQINSEGFRDRDPVPLAKPKNEIRVFLLGGSTAFGYGNSDNTATIGEYLEKRLQQRLKQQKTSPQLYKPDLLPFDEVERQKYLVKPSKIKPGNYRTINAGVPGYASGNELAQLALKILKYKPDVIVVLDGYKDLMLRSDLEAVPAPQLDQNQPDRPTSFIDYFSQLVEPIENKSYLARIAQNRWLNKPKTSQKSNFLLDEPTSMLVKHLPQDRDELQQRVNRYIEHQKQILNLSTAAGIPLVVAIQPEITGRNPSQLTDTEGRIATKLGRTYIKQVRESYPVLIKATQQLASNFPQNMKAVDLYKLTERYPSPSFIDPIHLNEAANQQVAEQLYYAISSLPKMQLVPQQAPPPKPVYPQSPQSRRSY